MLVGMLVGMRLAWRAEGCSPFSAVHGDEAGQVAMAIGAEGADSVVTQVRLAHSLQS
jgi:hypothetical protein